MMSSATRPPRIAVAYAATVALTVVGLAVAVSTDLVGLGAGLLNGSAISTPLPFLFVQGLFVALAVRARGAAAGASASALVALMGLIGIVSGFGDGSYAKSTLSAPDRTIQLALVVAIAALVLAAAAHGRTLLRRRAVAV